MTVQTQMREDSGETAAPPDYPLLGSYRLIQRLGEGGMGVVHLGLDRYGKAVAVKVLRPHIAHDPDARKRLAREVESLSRVRSNRVAPIIDADVSGDRPYLVTRYVPGPALDEVVAAGGPMHGQHLHRLAGGLAEAIEAIHRADVIHRDLKPGTVLMVDGEPVLIDFGIAHIADDIRLTMTGLVMGTPGYLAPEVVDGAPVSTATDWWGWAATVAFAATSKPPFGRGPMDSVLSRVAAGDADLSGVDPRIAPLLYAALSPVPSERPHQLEVIEGLRSYAHGGEVTDAVTLRRPVSAAAPSATALTESVQLPPTSVMPQRTLQSAPPPAPHDQSAPAPAPNRPPVAREIERPRRQPQAPPAYQAHQPQPIQPPAQQVPPQPRPGEPAPPYAAQPQPDPRATKARRSGTMAALLLLILVGGAAAPVVTGTTLLILMVLARTADRSLTSLVLRRHSKGTRRSDIPVAVLSAPWHLVLGIIGAALGAILPTIIGICAGFAASLVITLVVPNSGLLTAYGSGLLASYGPIAMAALMGALVAWWGPGGTSLRRGSRSLVRATSPGPYISAIFVVLVLIAAAGIAAYSIATFGAPTWMPLSEPGWTGGVRLR